MWGLQLQDGGLGTTSLSHNLFTKVRKQRHWFNEISRTQLSAFKSQSHVPDRIPYHPKWLSMAGVSSFFNVTSIWLLPLLVFTPPNHPSYNHAAPAAVFLLFYFIFFLPLYSSCIRKLLSNYQTLWRSFPSSYKATQLWRHHLLPTLHFASLILIGQAMSHGDPFSLHMPIWLHVLLSTFNEIIQQRIWLSPYGQELPDGQL